MSGRVRAVKDLMQVACISLVMYLGVHAAVAPRWVDGQSMEPTLHNHEWLMLDKVSYMLHEPRRGDIIVFRFPGDPSEDYVKRVIGVAGDRVVVKGGSVYVNGRMLTERYIANSPDYQARALVPRGSLYVLGDNRDNSSDSHVWGFVPLANVEGRAMFSYWPLPDLTLLP